LSAMRAWFPCGYLCLIYVGVRRLTPTYALFTMERGIHMNDNPANPLVGTRVRLVKFKGKTSCPCNVQADKNYWKLLGEKGVVIKTNLTSKGGRAFVEFDASFEKLGLKCHYEIENALWVLIEDLFIIPEEELNYLVGKRVRLNTINGEISSPDKVRAYYDYWKLIGQEGVVVKTALMGELGISQNGKRVLVKLDINVEGLGLHCHNEVENALWFSIEDLSIVPECSIQTTAP